MGQVFSFCIDQIIWLLITTYEHNNGGKKQN